MVADGNADVGPWLFEPRFKPVWQAAADIRDPVTPGDVERLRRAAPAGSATAVGPIVTQTLLRRRARRLLGPAADDLLLTEAGLQQCSRPVVSQRRAALLAGAVPAVADLGCGIGADSLAFAAAGLAVTAVDNDPTTAAIAAANLAGIADVTCADLRSFDLAGAPAVFVDPARREQERRLMNPEQWHPPWSWVLAAGELQPALVAKAAPGIPHAVLPQRAAVEHVSVDRALVETTVWFPGLRQGMPDRRAVAITTVPSRPWETATVRELSSDEPRREAPAGPLLDWLVVPDPAVIRSGLVAELADRLAGHLVSPGIAYITCPRDPGVTLGRRFRVIETLPARVRPLRAAMAARRFGSVEIRTRGLDLDPAQLRRGLRLTGSGPAAELVLTRLNGQAAAVLVRSRPD